jgi:predicted amidophosphoribosyltransferase
MITNTIISVADYYGTTGARELVHRVKNNDVEAIAIVARAMAEVAIECLHAGSVLIPVPSHTGHATNTLLLAELISQLTGCPVLDIVKGRKRIPWYTLKHKGLTTKNITGDFFGFRLIDDTKTNIPIIPDAVFDTGSTANAIAKLFSKPFIIFAYARVTPISICPKSPLIAQTLLKLICSDCSFCSASAKLYK